MCNVFEVLVKRLLNFCLDIHFKSSFLSQKNFKIFNLIQKHILFKFSFLSAASVVINAYDLFSFPGCFSLNQKICFHDCFAFHLFFVCC